MTMTTEPISAGGSSLLSHLVPTALTTNGHDHVDEAGDHESAESSGDVLARPVPHRPR